MPHAAELALQGLGKFPSLAPGQQVLVNGAGGGVGTLALQLLKQYGVETTGVDRVEKLPLLRDLGYDHVLEYPRENFTRTGKQYDFILDTKTSESAFDYLRALKPGGIYATVGGLKLFSFMLLSLLCKPFTSKRLQMVALKPNQHLDRISELFEAGKLRPVIDRIYPFTAIPAAMSRFRGEEHQGKIVIKVS